MFFSSLILCRNPILQILGDSATPADIGALRHQYGLDALLGAQYVRYWNGVLHGDLGSFIRLQPDENDNSYQLRV
jgi:ABC-type dipeptide/oligopeptide/nickel transport system permease component